VAAKDEEEEDDEDDEEETARDEVDAEKDTEVAKETRENTEMKVKCNEQYKASDAACVNKQRSAQTSWSRRVRKALLLHSQPSFKFGLLHELRFLLLDVHADVVMPSGSTKQMDKDGLKF
jgi:hypothetical protein